MIEIKGQNEEIRRLFGKCTKTGRNSCYLLVSVHFPKSVVYTERKPVYVCSYVYVCTCIQTLCRNAVKVYTALR